jgi:alpha-D-ribose 1-methylphosphonate 5-triphosphate diphosphatase PhnM
LRPGLFEEVLQGEGVHDRAQHAHVVGASAIHAALAEFGASKEVATTHDHGNVDLLGRFGNFLRERSYDIGIYSQGAAAKGFAGEFEEDATTC